MDGRQAALAIAGVSLLLSAAGLCVCIEPWRAPPLLALAVALGGLARPELARRCWNWMSQRRKARRRTLPLNHSFALPLETLHAKPLILSCADFIDEAACETLIASAEPHLVPSPEGAGDGGPSRGRTSKSCMLSRKRPECQAFLERCAALTGCPVAHFEDPQVSRYLSGEHYEAHYDAPDRSEPDGRGFMRCGGTRMATVLVYLNTVAHGGETKFTRLRTPASRLVVQPRRGTALLFFPANAKGRVDARLEHEARPPREGEVKWVAQAWLRQKPDPTRTFIDNPRPADGTGGRACVTL